MKEYTKDTAAEYDDMVGYIAEENLPVDLSSFLGEEEEKEYKQQVKAKTIDKDFPEKWQNLYVNFRCLEDYKEFMLLINKKPVPKLKELVFNGNDDDDGILNFL